MYFKKFTSSHNTSLYTQNDLFIYCFIAQVLKVCRTLGPTAYSKTLASFTGNFAGTFEILKDVTGKSS